MENLAKMADFLDQMLYKVFDLIWSFRSAWNEYSINISFILNAGCRIYYGNYSWIW